MNLTIPSTKEGNEIEIYFRERNDRARVLSKGNEIIPRYSIENYLIDPCRRKARINYKAFF